MSNKIRLFSDKDNTKFFEDLKTIAEKVGEGIDDFFDERLILLIAKFKPLARKIINFLKLVDAEIKEGTPTDKVIDSVLAKIKIKGDPDERLYKFIQNNLHGFIGAVEDFLEDIELFNGDEEMLAPVHAKYESLRHKTASILLQSFVAEQGEEISRVESDTCIQVVYFAGVM